MGGSESKSNDRQPTLEVRPKPEPKPILLTPTPWRQPSIWNEELERKLKEDIQLLDPMKNGEKPNILLMGPVGVGKSSFINSVMSIGKGRKCELAISGGVGKSWTLEAERYTDKCLLTKFYLLDTMGVERKAEEGFNVLDVVKLLKGHIKKGYAFNPKSSIKSDDTYYRRKPKFRHQTHCVIFVVDALTVYFGIDEQYKKKIFSLQDQLRREHIPRILILTKVDKFCGEVEKDIKNMFSSVKVKEAVKIASEIFCIAKASIHPVKNYEEDYDINTSTNIPLLLALKQAMEYANDRVEHVLNDVESQESDESD